MVSLRCFTHATGSRTITGAVRRSTTSRVGAGRRPAGSSRVEESSESVYFLLLPSVSSAKFACSPRKTQKQAAKLYKAVQTSKAAKHAHAGSNKGLFAALALAKHICYCEVIPSHNCSPAFGVDTQWQGVDAAWPSVSQNKLTQ